MITCTICHEPTWWFFKNHESCEQLVEEHKQQLVTFIETSIVEGHQIEHVEKRLNELAEQKQLPTNTIKEYCIHGWESAVEKFLDDGLLDHEEQAKLEYFKQAFKLSDEDLNHNGSLDKVQMAEILRDIAEGNNLDHWKAQQHDYYPFNLKKSEDLIWLFQSTPYHEGRMKRPTIKLEHMIELDDPKIIYYTSKAFTGKLIDTREMIYRDTGMLGVTTRNLYFYGNSMSFRIQYEDIVSFSPFENGLGLTRDALEAKPQFFLTDHGWFTYNLVKNIISRF